MINKIAFITILGIVLLGSGYYFISSSNPITKTSSTLEWNYLSSIKGDIPKPGPSTEQTASLILDIDKDGLNDFIIGSRVTGPSLLWYRQSNNTWKKYIIDNTFLPIEAGGAYHDIDRDGDLDIVFGGDWQSNKVWWWENPFPKYDSTTPWTRHEIKNSGANKHHDQIFGDFDSDGEDELVFWNQNANKLFIVDIPSDPITTQPWSYTEIWSGGTHAEGLSKGDIDNDGKIDLLGGGRWFKHISGTDYTAYLIDDQQKESRIAVGDLKMGGLLEVVMVPGDGVGRLKWYECTGEPTEPSCWEGHDLLGFDVDHGHSLAIADFNSDGNLDIFVGEMRLDSGNPDAKMWIFLGNGNGNFQTQLISEGIGNHESKVGDLNGDGHIDILSKPYNWNTPRIDIWQNNGISIDFPIDSWERHIIDQKKPWKTIFITAADIDNDGKKDIITGAWWYKNPGFPGGNWERHTIGSTFNNMASIYDFDSDGDNDILGTTGKGSDPSSVFVWAKNDGKGTFTILNNIEQGDGDFLQGVAVEYFKSEDSIEVALSWHVAEKGVQMLTVPSDSSNETWSWRRISPTSQDEALSPGDIDQDGDTDLLLGTKWLRNDGGSWKTFALNPTSESPDRNRLVDINGDGRLDAIVGFEAINKPGKLAWYEQGNQATSTWTEHVIATIIGPMSLDIADMDNDGNPDIVAGEHNMANPSSANLYIFKNGNGQGTIWTRHVVYTGDEHHDGAVVVDIDGDRDNDIISIGWGHDQVILYENKAK